MENQPTYTTIEELDNLLVTLGYDNIDVSKSNQRKYFYKTINACVIEVSRDKTDVTYTACGTGNNINVSNYSARIIYLRNAPKITRKITYHFDKVSLSSVIKLIEEEVTILTNRMRRNDELHKL